MSGLILAAALAVLAAGARAETFTFHTEGQPARAAVLPARTDGAAGGSIAYTRASLTTRRGTLTVKAVGECTTWTPPADAPFSVEAVCRLSDAAGGVYTLGYSCDPPGLGADCRAELAARGGAFAGRRGRLVFPAADAGENLGAWDEAPAPPQSAGMKLAGRWSEDALDASADLSP